MVQVIFRNVFEDATISINIKKFCNVPLSEEERGLAYQILGCYVTKPFLENCIIQQEKLVNTEEKNMSYELRGTTTLKEDMEINRSKYVETNIGKIPLEDYREIRAMQCGFDSYEDMLKEGYCIGVE